MTPPWPDGVSRLMAALQKLPGIGQKTAQRLTFFLLRQDPEFSRTLAEAIWQGRAEARWCQRCFNLAEGPLCTLCQDPRRVGSQICVVEEPFNIWAIENTHIYRGQYHVLHGVLSPMRGIGPDRLRIDSLLNRLDQEPVREIILATSSTTEGSATAHYLAECIRPRGLELSRIGLGIPVGADLDYLDAITIGRALEARTRF